MRKFEYALPFNDNKLEYDYELHQYILKKDFAISRFGMEVSSKYNDDEWEIFTRQLSDNIYSFIYSFKTGLEDHDIMEFELANNQYYREVLAEVLLNQFEYAFTTSGDLVQLQHALNVGIDKDVNVTLLRGELMVATKAYLKLYYCGLLTSTNTYQDFNYNNYRKGY